MGRVFHLAEHMEDPEFKTKLQRKEGHKLSAF